MIPPTRCRPALVAGPDHLIGAQPGVGAKEIRAGDEPPRYGRGRACTRSVAPCACPRYSEPQGGVSARRAARGGGMADEVRVGMLGLGVVGTGVARALD